LGGVAFGNGRTCHALPAEGGRRRDSHILRSFATHDSLATMSYMLLIHEPTGQRAERTEAQGRAVYDRMVAWGASLQERGLLHASESLETPDARTARLQVRKGKALVLDGPFAEAKEFIGGFFLLKVETREDALAIAHTCPAAEWATVEVRGIAPCYD
jgi:hypothetical protein